MIFSTKQSAIIFGEKLGALEARIERKKAHTTVPEHISIMMF